MRSLPPFPRPLSPGERPFTGPTWPDAYIEFWAGIYLEPQTNRALRGRGVRFETFLRAPVEILAALQRPRAIVSYCGLLPAQRHVRERADLQAALLVIAEVALAHVDAESHCANGRVVEKLRHHAHPRSAKRDFHPVR